MKDTLRELYQDMAVTGFLFILVYLAFSTFMYIRISMYEELRMNVYRAKPVNTVYSINQLPVQLN